MEKGAGRREFLTVGVKERQLKSNNGITKKGKEIHQSLQALGILPQNLRGEYKK